LKLSRKSRRYRLFRWIWVTDPEDVINLYLGIFIALLLGFIVFPWLLAEYIENRIKIEKVEIVD
jgi:hypothetical protein